MLFSVFGSLLGHFLSGLVLPLLAWCCAVSWEPGSAVMVVMYACAVTCGRSFTVSSVWGVLISFLECFSVFSHPPLPFYYFYIIIVFVVVVVVVFFLFFFFFFTFIRYYCYYYFHRAPGSV